MLASQPLARRSSGVKLEGEDKAEWGKNVGGWDEDGAPDWSRTSDPWLRKPILYPAELRAHKRIIGGGSDGGCAGGISRRFASL